MADEGEAQAEDLALLEEPRNRGDWSNDDQPFPDEESLKDAWDIPPPPKLEDLIPPPVVEVISRTTDLPDLDAPDLPDAEPAPLPPTLSEIPEPPVAASESEEPMTHPRDPADEETKLPGPAELPAAPRPPCLAPEILVPPRLREGSGIEDRHRVEAKAVLEAAKKALKERGRPAGTEGSVTPRLSGKPTGSDQLSELREFVKKME